MLQSKSGVVSTAKFEPLETRRLLAAEPVISITSRGTLLVEGTDAGERIDVSVRGTSVRVLISQGRNESADVRFPLAVIKRLALNAGAGNDTIQVSPGFQRPAVIAGGTGNDFLFQGSGETVLMGERGNDIVGRPGEQLTSRPVTLAGGIGDDLLQADENAFVEGGAGQDKLARGNSLDIPGAGEAEAATFYSAGITAGGVLYFRGTDKGEELAVLINRIPGNGGQGIATGTQVVAFSEELGYTHLMEIGLRDYNSVVIEGLGGDDELLADALLTVPCRLVGGAGNDVMRATNEGSVLEGGDGNDRLTGTFAVAVEDLNGVTQLKESASGAVTILGGAGDDTLAGDSNDHLDGGAGRDAGSLEYRVIKAQDEIIGTTYEALVAEYADSAAAATRAFMESIDAASLEKFSPYIRRSTPDGTFQG